MKIICVIPTYNEKDNISHIVNAIQSLYPHIHILIVDDNSPDGTGKIADRLKGIKIDVLHREKKKGLGKAYLDGFTKALNDGADIIIQMDADCSHDPVYIKDLLENIKDHDIVIGSRYMDGINIVNWSLSRLILSYFGNAYAKIMTGVKITDFTSGFKCITRKALTSINFNKIKSNGYLFQVEMNYAFWQKGFRIKETSIIFYERRKGKSNMSKNIIIEAILKTPFLRFKKY